MTQKLAAYAFCLTCLLFGMNEPCYAETAKEAEECTRLIQKLVNFFEAIPKSDPKEGSLKCYRKQMTPEVILEVILPAHKRDGSEDKADRRAGVMSILGTYFTVQEIRDFSKSGISFTYIEKADPKTELNHTNVKFSDVLPYFNGHNF